MNTNTRKHKRALLLFPLVLKLTGWDNYFHKSVFYYAFTGDIFLVPNKTFLVMGGVKVFSLQSVTFQLGTRTTPLCIRFSEILCRV